jgi:hypothetical protein
MENWKVKIMADGPTLEDKLFIFRKRENNQIEIINKIDNGIMCSIVQSIGQDIAPTASIRTEDMREIVRAFVKYAQEQGFKSSDETFNKGKLEATEKHLEDMRTLVFKKNPLK